MFAVCARSRRHTPTYADICRPHGWKPLVPVQRHEQQWHAPLGWVKLSEEFGVRSRMIWQSLCIICVIYICNLWTYHMMCPGCFGSCFDTTRGWQSGRVSVPLHCKTSTWAFFDGRFVPRPSKQTKRLQASPFHQFAIWGFFYRLKYWLC